MAEEDGANASDRIVTEFNTYEEFLDSQITPLDLYYLEVCFSYYLFIIIFLLTILI